MRLYDADARLQCVALQDVEALVHTARRRAADEKAGVRKAGVALLEALLRLRASPPPPLQRLPREADVAALAAAAGDPLVRQNLVRCSVLGNVGDQCHCS